MENKKRKSYIRIFVSSTFEDMKEERDYLINHIYPRLAQKAENSGLQLTFIDLRWGLNSEMQNGIICNCLDEVDKAQPFFLGILGHRYGWCPNNSELLKDRNLIQRHPWVINESECAKPKSITELEFIKGIWQGTKNELKAKLFSKAPEIYDEPDLKALKQRIRIDFPLIQYATVSELGEFIYNAVSKIIAENAIECSTKEEKIASLTEIKIREHLKTCLKTETITRVLEEIDNNLYLNKTLLIKGDGGTGKSILTDFVISHIRGKGCYSYKYSLSYFPGGLNAIFKYFNHELDNLKLNYIRTNVQKPRHSIGDEVAKFLSYAEAFNEDLTIIFIIDGIENLPERELCDLYSVINHLPSNAKFMLTQRNDIKYEGKDFLLRQRTIHLPAWRIDDLSLFITNYLSGFGKRLTDKQIKRILSKSYIQNVTNLRVFLDQIIKFGSYYDLDKYIDNLLSEESEEGFYETIIDNVGQFYGKIEVKDVSTLLILTRCGLTESEISSIIGIPINDILVILFSLRSIIINNNGRFYSQGNSKICLYVHKQADRFLNIVYKFESFLLSSNTITQDIKSNKTKQRIIIELANLYWSTHSLLKLFNLIIPPEIFIYMTDHYYDYMQKWFKGGLELLTECKSWCNSLADCSETDYLEYISILFMSIRKYDVSLQFYERLTYLYENSNYKLTEFKLIKIYNNISLIYLETQQYDKSLEFLSKNLNLIERFKQSSSLSSEQYEEIFISKISTTLKIATILLDGHLLDYAHNLLDSISEEVLEHIQSNRMIDVLSVITSTVAIISSQIKVYQEKGDVEALDLKRKGEWYLQGLELCKIYKFLLDKYIPINKIHRYAKSLVLYNSSVLRTKLKNIGTDVENMSNLACNELDAAIRILGSDNDQESKILCQQCLFNRALYFMETKEWNKASRCLRYVIDITEECKIVLPNQMTSFNYDAQFYLAITRYNAGEISFEEYQSLILKLFDSVTSENDEYISIEIKLGLLLTQMMDEPSIHCKDNLEFFSFIRDKIDKAIQDGIQIRSYTTDDLRRLSDDFSIIITSCDPK